MPSPMTGSRPSSVSRNVCGSRKRRSQSSENDLDDWTPAKRPRSFQLPQNAIPMAQFGQASEEVCLSPSVWQDLASASAREWRPLARHLGLGDSAIDGLDGVRHDDAEKCYQMFRVWREMKGSRAVWGDLSFALEKVGRATALCQIIGRHSVRRRIAFDESDSDSGL